MNAPIEIRPKTIGGSDAQRIWKGDWISLWEEKTGRAEPADLSDVFRVQLGIHTEQFHLDWIKSHHGHSNMMPPAGNGIYTHPNCAWAHVSPDAVLAGPTKDIPVEVKHTNARMDVWESASYYSAQLQHAMAIMDAPQILFSAICGNEAPKPVWIDRDDNFIAELVSREAAFWDYVERDERPGDQEVGTATVACLREVDMGKNNAWVNTASQITDIHPKHAEMEKSLKSLKEEIKGLVPEDARRAFGAGVNVSRNTKGALVLTVK